VGDGALRRPANWWLMRNPFRPSWGEPYVEIAARMLAAVETARDAARGSAAVLVSHQLPIWTVRLHVEGRRYVHDPRRRECGLASVTSLSYDGDRLVGISYAEPAGATDPDEVPGA
ncbi:histidine phosphatase family protein, partial [Modestobacter roseus]